MEQVLARMAGGAHGVVTRAQLVRLGITPEEIKQRLRGGLCFECTAAFIPSGTERRAWRRTTWQRYWHVAKDRC
jgi:hypothetical protein